MRRAAALLLALGALAGGCARRPPPAPPAEPDEYPAPAFAPGEASAEERKRTERAWQLLRAGDVARAEAEFQKLLRRQPALIQAETGLAFAQLRGGRLPEARRTFASTLDRRPSYVPALLGAALTEVRSGDAERALLLLRRAETADPNDPLVRRRLAEVRLQLTDRRLAAAQAAAAAGQPEEAIAIYRRALEDAPEVSGLRLELAELLVGRGDVAGALALLEADPTGDRALVLRSAEIFRQQADYDRALEAYRRLLALDPRDEEALRLSGEVRAQMELLQMPEEYRRIPEAATVTRADLAALVGVKVTALSRVAPGPSRVAVDISGSWAREHIIKALAYDIMTVYPNHTFQPAAVVRRGDLARAVQRVLDLLDYPAAPAPTVADMARNNLHYYAASRVVAAGLMELNAVGAFEAWRPVSGHEAVSVLEGLVRLVGP